MGDKSHNTSNITLHEISIGECNIRKEQLLLGVSIRLVITSHQPVIGYQPANRF
jgi:hypothetical protein